MKKILISGPELNGKGGVVTFVKALNQGLEGRYGLVYVTKNSLLKVLMSGLWRFDVVLINSNNLLALPILIARFFSIKKPKLIFIAHGEMGKELPVSFKKLLLIICQKIILFKSNKIIFVSNMFRSDFLKKHGMSLSDKSITIPNGIINVEKFNSKKKKGTVVYAGGDRDEKGVELIRQFILDRSLFFEGSMEFIFIGSMKNTTYKVSDNLTIRKVQAMDEHEFLKVLSGSEVFISPSKYETYGIALIQAHMLGCKVVTYSKAGALEYISSSSNLYIFENYNYTDFIKAFLNAYHADFIVNYDDHAYVSIDEMIGLYREVIESELL